MEDDSPIIYHGPPPPQKGSLTFGIEIEFALVTAPESRIDPEPHLGGQIFGMPNEELAQVHVLNTLQGIGVQAEIED